MLSRTRRRSSATSSSPICTRSSRGATPSRCAERSSLQQPAMDPVFAGHARRRPTSLIAVAKKDPATAAQVSAGGLPHMVDRALPGRRRGARRGAAEGHRGRHAAGAHRAAPPRPPTPRAAPIARRRATSSSSRIRRRCSATDAARTSRGCRSCPIRSRRSAGARGSRSIPRPRSGSASIAATSSR